MICTGIRDSAIVPSGFMEIPGSGTQTGPVTRIVPLPWVLCLASASCSAQTLVIGLYDYSGLSAKDTVRLTEITNLVFTHSGIHLVWRHCRGALAVEPDPMCDAELQVNEIVVSLRPGGPPSSDSDRTLHMGHSIVTADGGAYVNIYVPAVRAQAVRFGLQLDLLTGHAVAHEIGHCLLGPGHSYAGLMRRQWNSRDAAEMSRLGLHLTKSEARKAATRLVP